ncbi:MAG: hypothetical protein RDV48_14625 [Candidatus Eremiobacteraeota bacterium]|nr:hypothetical protein [Candidatus Eremiobacteraeota bacterium]
MEEKQEKEEKKPFNWKPIAIGCGIVLLLAAGVVAYALVWLFSGPESGVKMANEMDKYAIDYLESHKVLNGTEKLVAYYDETTKMDGSEAAILTTERVLYHKQGATTALAIKDIRNVEHRKETLTGDIIEVTADSGERLKIEIAPFNGGESFFKALMDLWKGDSREKASPSQPEEKPEKSEE